MADLALIVGDVVHNLRASFDLLAWQLVEANNEKPGTTTAFPVWQSEAQFLGGGAGHMKGAHPDAIDQMRGLKPHKGGNETLWRLHRLDATDKHRLLLAVGAIQSKTIYRFSLFGQEKTVQIPNPRVALEDGSQIFRVQQVARDYFEKQPKPDFSLLISLNESVVPPGQPIIDTLERLARFTNTIVTGFFRWL